MKGRRGRVTAFARGFSEGKGEEGTRESNKKESLKRREKTFPGRKEEGGDSVISGLKKKDRDTKKTAKSDREPGVRGGGRNFFKKKKRSMLSSLQP